MQEINCIKRYALQQFVCYWHQHVYSSVTCEGYPQKGRKQTPHNLNNLILCETMSVTSRAWLGSVKAKAILPVRFLKSVYIALTLGSLYH